MPAFRSISSSVCVLLCMGTVLLCRATAGPLLLKHCAACLAWGHAAVQNDCKYLAQGLFMSMLLHHSARRCLGVAACRLVRSILTGMTWPLLLCRARASSGHTSSASMSA